MQAAFSLLKSLVSLTWSAFSRAFNHVFQLPLPIWLECTLFLAFISWPLACLIWHHELFEMPYPISLLWFLTFLASPIIVQLIIIWLISMIFRLDRHIMRQK